MLDRQIPLGLIHGTGAINAVLRRRHRPRAGRVEVRRDAAQRDPFFRRTTNLPREDSEIKGKDGKTYLQFNTQMVTFYKQTYGEHSRFFLALRDGRLIGASAPSAGR